MKIGIIGCGYVVDHYLKTLGSHASLELAGVTDRDHRRADAVGARYRAPVYESNEALLAEPNIDLVVNLTSVESHYPVTRASLLAGKHVYCEKPFTRELSEAKELADLADQKGLMLSGAPCNALSDSVQTLWKAILDGAIGDVQLVYAELDDNPIYLMKPETWSSASGAPWPYLDEYRQGCTLEHAGYHLGWLCAVFGPAISLTAFSACLVPDKTSTPVTSPDFSVACITFKSGVVARLTCSIVAPLDHRITIVGRKGMLRTDTYRHYEAPVYLETFTDVSLNARKLRTVRASRMLQRLFGVGGRKQVLVRGSDSAARQSNHPTGPSAGIGGPARRLLNRELGLQDKLLGVAEMAEAIDEGRRCLLPMDFIIHVTELTLAISRSGSDGEPYEITTTFEPLSPKRETIEAPRRYRPAGRDGVIGAIGRRLIERAHKH